MNVENDVYPHRPASIKMLQESGPDGPTYMVNLLKFRERAEYKDGRESKLSGKEAYNLYATEVTQVIQQHGGKILFSADISGLLLGHVDELWDAVAIAQYPNRAALIAMSMSEGLSEPSKHREAGLQGQLNIETVGTGLFD